MKKLPANDIYFQWPVL